MTQKLEDLRIRRTRKLLQQALLEATRDKGFAHVTVRDITERAMVNRATFYRHYQDKYDLLAQYVKELSEFIDAEAGEPSANSQAWASPDTPPPGLVKLLKHIQENANFYRVMLGRQGDPAFCGQAFQDYIEQGYRRILSSQAIHSDPTRPPIGLTVSSLISAGIGALVWWLEQDQPCSPEQMAVWLYRLSMASMNVSLQADMKTEDIQGKCVVHSQ